MSLNFHQAIIAASRRRGGAFDPDAADYFARIVTAGSTISEANKTAVNAFVVGCKADGIWSAIKASCILAGADTLAGALVPLVGPAPTNVGPFEAGDYSRTTGLLGDGSTKYLNSNRNNNADPQDSKHLSSWLSSAVNPSANSAAVGAGITSTGSSHLGLSTTGQAFVRVNRSSAASLRDVVSTGLYGAKRASSESEDYRYNGTDINFTSTSEVPLDQNVLIHGRTIGGAYYPGRLAFYSIGESLDLAQLDSRLATLMGALT